MSDVTTEAPPRSKQTNDLGYHEINARTFVPLGDRILVAWDEAQEEMKIGGVLLARPATHVKMHYTGSVISVGPDVTVDVETGDRILFDQFSNFDKYFDSKLGRMALISERAQASAFAVIPKRIKVNSAQSDYNYDA